MGRRGKLALKAGIEPAPRSGELPNTPRYLTIRPENICQGKTAAPWLAYLPPFLTACQLFAGLRLWPHGQSLPTALCAIAGEFEAGLSRLSAMWQGFRLHPPDQWHFAI